jgi:hypothetical protein
VRFIFPFLSTLSIVHSCWSQITYRLGKTKFSPQPPLQISNQNLIKYRKVLSMCNQKE